MARIRCHNLPSSKSAPRALCASIIRFASSRRIGIKRSAKDIIIDGNVIKAKEIAKAEDAKDGELSGFMPLSRVLVKREADGTETVLKKGVLDYSLCDEGILISNGRQITLFADGNETLVTKAYLARNLQAGMSENK